MRRVVSYPFTDYDSAMTTASVIVPARDEGDLLARTLDSLAAQCGAIAYEVIVVAAGDDGTIAAARDHPATDRVVVDDRRDGAGRARNAGAAVADGDLLLFTDADTVVPPSWVRRHRRHYANAEVAGVGGPMRPLEGGVRHRIAFRVLSDWWYRLSWPVGFVQQPGCNCSVRREAFEAIGGFDESLPFVEDTELSLRLADRGTVVYDRRCPVWTSARRQAAEGYGSLFFAYLIGYVECFLLGRTPSREYERS